MSGQLRVPQELSRVLYKTFLRASRNGRHPEVFGRFGAVAYNAQCQNNQDHISLALPDNPYQVRGKLKSWFRNPAEHYVLGSEIEPLAALRLVREQEEILPPRSVDLATDPPPCLPIFDCDEVATLPGEKTQLMFLEPRYQELALIAMSSTKTFLLRPFKESRDATLVKIISHLEMDNGSIIVTCLGGHRVSILEEEKQIIEAKNQEDDMDSNSFLAIASTYQLLNDKEQSSWSDDLSFPQDVMETRQYILDLLNCVLPNQERSLSETLEHFGLPPLDPEAFSFWALRLVLSVDDTASRLKWLFQCRSLADRLDFIVHEVESILDAQEADMECVATSG